MSVKKLTTTSTVADLEGRIHAVMQCIFPWLKMAKLTVPPLDTRPPCLQPIRSTAWRPLGQVA